MENEYYDAIGQVLIWTLKQQLGQDFTKPVQKAWEEAFAFLSSIMKEAATESKSEKLRL
nr:globin domain-containing protein [Gloeocapsa sp. PCC 73106]